MAGYAARAGRAHRGIRDTPWARAIVLEGGELRLAVVSADLLLVTADLKRAVIEQMGGLALDGLLLAATHDHSGPGGYFDNALAEAAALGPFDPSQRDRLASAIAESIRLAASSTEPARLRLASLLLPGYARNRRFDDGPTDPVLVAIECVGESGARLATAVSYGTHPTILGPENRLVGGEFPGALSRAVEARTGGVCLFLNAAAGDQGPVPPRGAGDDGDSAERLGAALARASLELLDRMPASPSATLGVARARLELPRREPRSTVGSIFAPFLYPLFRSLTPSETEMTALAVGDLRLVGFPCDFGAGLGRAVRALSDRQLVVPVSYADDYIGYAVDERSYRRGGYEAWLSFYGAGLGEDLVEAASALLRALPR